MKTIAVTGGKGGVGKTTFTANLAIALAQLGRRVVVFDADLGLANLDIMLGVKARFSLLDCVRDGLPLIDAVQDGPGGIRFIAGGSGMAELVALDSTRLDGFLRQLAALEHQCDELIFDTAAGLQEGVTRFLEAADESLLVCTPDPSSMMDAYATAKTLFAARPGARIKVVVNMVADEREAREVFHRLREIAGRFLDRTLWFGGFVRKDPTAAECVRRREPFVLNAPDCAAARDVTVIARALTGFQHRQEPLFARLAQAFRVKAA